MRWVLLVLACVVLLVGCNMGKVEPVIEPDWYSCSMWTVCAIPPKEVYNVSASDCNDFDSVTAKWMWDLMRKYDIRVSADCAQKGGLIVKQVVLP